MKRVLITLLLVTLLVGLLPLSASLAENYVSVYSGNEFGVRLREGPGTGYASIMTVPNGTTMILVENGTIWSRVTAGTTTGYMMTKYLLGAGTNIGVTVTATATVTSQNGLKVWLRTAENGKRIGLYSVGTPVSVISRGDTWSRVMIGSSIGYMMTEFLAFPEPTPVPPVQTLTAVSLNYVYPLVGDTLTPITVPADATVTYKWERIDQSGNVVQEIGNSGGYAVVATDKNYAVRVTVTGTGLYNGSVSFTSNLVTDTKAITGVQVSKSEPAVGDVLSAVMAPSSATVTYSWRVNGTEKGTEATYTVTNDDIGKAIQVRVTATGSYTGSASSQSTQAVTSATVVQSVKLNTIVPIVGNTMSATVTPSNASVSYVWYVDEAPVAYTPTYIVSSVDLGYKIKVKVTGSGSYTGSATSDSTRDVSKALVSHVYLNKTSPVIGDTITATVTPADATVQWKWYGYDAGNDETVEDAVGHGVLSTTNTYTVTNDKSGWRFFARAISTGIYGSTGSGYDEDAEGYYRDSDTTTATASQWELTAVTLDVTAPNVGDIIRAKVTPAIEAGATDLTYLWYQEGTVVQVTATNEYIVQPDDEGKRLRVRVNGGGGYIGSVTSDYTAAVTATKDLTGVKIYILDENWKASSSTVPRMGLILWADPQPLQADPVDPVSTPADNISYQWTLNGKNIVGATDRYLKVDNTDWKGQILGVTITGKNYYKGTKSTTAPAVLNTKDLDIKIPDTVVPVANQYPKTSYTVDAKENYKCTSIVWTPELNANGTFKPNETYTAVFTFSFTSGYGMNENGITCSSGVKVKASAVTSTVEWSFSTATAEQLVTLYSITGIETPVVGATPGTEIDSTAQYTGTVAWDPAHTVFQSGTAYTATINLSLKDGYVLDSSMIGTGAFRVENATATILDSYDSSTKTAVIKATYGKMDNIVTVTGTKTQATAGQTVQFIGKVSSYAGDADLLPWSWTVSGATSTNTKIDAVNGNLTIGEDETEGKALTITGKVTIFGTELTGKTTLQIVAATEAPTGDVSVEFLKAPNSVTVVSTAAAPTVQFVAVAKNALNEGVKWSISGNKSKDTSIDSNGLLTVGSDETSSKITITAKAQVDTTKSAVHELTVILEKKEPAYLEFTEVYSSVKPGDTASFKVELVNSSGAEGDIVFATDTKYVTVGSTASGVIELTVKDTTPIDTTIRIFAYCENDDSISTKYSFKVTSTSQVSTSTASTSLTTFALPQSQESVAPVTVVETTENTTGAAEENTDPNTVTAPATETTTGTEGLNMMD